MTVDNDEEVVDVEKLEEIFEVRKGAEAKTSGWMLDSDASRHMTYIRHISPNSNTTAPQFKSATAIGSGARAKVTYQ